MADRCIHLFGLHKENWSVCEQGGGATGSRCGVETRSRWLPWLCGARSDWQSAGFIWPTADSMLARLYAEKGKWEGRRCSRWTRDPAGLRLFTCAVFSFCTKRPVPRLLAIVHRQSPHTGHMLRGRGLHWSKLWYQQPLWPPVMNCRAGKEQQDPPTSRKHLHNHRDGTHTDSCWCNSLNTKVSFCSDEGFPN